MSAAKSASKLIVGNWKMNGLKADSRERVEKLMAVPRSSSYGMVLCPPAPLLGPVGDQIKGSALALGAQDCHALASGAYTGDVAAPLLKDMGCGYVILGHSERRQHHRETSAEVEAKARAAHAAGLVAIICIGETDAERQAGQAANIVVGQLAGSVPAAATPENTVIAYEPVWAIGTGKTATAEDVTTMHALIRKESRVKMRILYGGSVKPANAGEILHLPNVDGVLVGGASLKAEEFLAIAKAS
jgi:triosephosphate isomerase